jgi:hypothetical protein
LLGRVAAIEAPIGTISFHLGSGDSVDDRVKALLSELSFLTIVND